jgi:hypothetical protein
MPHALLHLLRYFLLGLVWLFFIYAIRMVYVEMRRSKVERAPAPSAGPLGSDRAVSLKLKVVDPPQRRGRVFELGEEVTLGRTNGTFLNDERLNDGPVRLQRGDRMKVGSTTLEVSR